MAKNRNKAPAPKTKTSPKVWLALAATIGVGALTSAADAIGPELFEGLGVLAPVALTTVSGLIAAGIAWLKEDRLRTVGAIIEQDHDEGGDNPPIGSLRELDDGTTEVVPPDDRRKK